MRLFAHGCMLSVMMMFACSSASSAVDRAPPSDQPSFEELEAELRYIGHDDLRAQMWTLASDVRELQNAFARGAATHDEGKKQITGILTALEHTAMHLDADAYRLHHAPAGLGAFRSEVRAAREGSERVPPEYHFAERIIGSCSYCHR